jgi:hypothetical protein
MCRSTHPLGSTASFEVESRGRQLASSPRRPPAHRARRRAQWRTTSSAPIRRRTSTRRKVVNVSGSRRTGGPSKNVVAMVIGGGSSAARWMVCVIRVRAPTGARRDPTSRDLARYRWSRAATHWSVGSMSASPSERGRRRRAVGLSRRSARCYWLWPSGAVGRGRGGVPPRSGWSLLSVTWCSPPSPRCASICGESRDRLRVVRVIGSGMLVVVDDGRPIGPAPEAVWARASGPVGGAGIVVADLRARMAAKGLTAVSLGAT